VAAADPRVDRIGGPRDVRVRFTVRHGGSARIYSDTASFTLRDGRSAELVIDREDTGDWEFFLAAGPDPIDAWVNDRESYLAQRLRYNSDYYDDYVWGAEELAAYGEWSYTNDFGWLWKPNPKTVSVYGDW